MNTAACENVRSHIDDIEFYQDQVVSGERIACRWERLAVDRQRKDLARQGTTEFPYVFDHYRAEKIIRFIETLPHVKGKWAAARGRDRLIRLQPWQKFCLGVLFGWIHVETRLRRFRELFLLVPRKNGKSIIAAGIGLYMLTEDEEYGAEVYCGATSEKQAMEVFRPAKRMVELKPTFRRAYGVSVHAKKLMQDAVGSKRISNGARRDPDDSRFEPVIGKPGDGASPHCAILDEVHEHPDFELYETMDTGMGSREQPLLAAISTAGSDNTGPCRALQDAAQEVLQGSRVDERLFAVIYTIDDPGDWKSERALRMANPNYGVSVGAEYLEAQRSRALQDARRMTSYKTKHLNLWVHASVQWMDMEAWNTCADPALTRDEYAGEPFWMGLDMSTSDDLAAQVVCYREQKLDGYHYTFFGRYYCTEAKIKGNNDYEAWVDEAYLTPTDGDMIDYRLIQDEAGEDIKAGQCEMLLFDPYGAANLTQNLSVDSGVEAVKMEQSFSNFTEPMRDFVGLVKARRVHHDGNPCLNWMMSNVVAKLTRDEKMQRPVKDSRDKKIDGAVALLMAFKAAYKPEEEDDNGEPDIVIL